jgi:hypothetical protein
LFAVHFENLKHGLHFETGNFGPLGRMLRSKSEEGSFAKMILLGYISPDLAGREAEKLGLKDRTVTAMVGNDPVIIKMRGDTPIGGFNARTNKELDPQQLVTAAAGAQQIKGTEVGATVFGDPTGKVPGTWTLERRAGGSQFRQVGTNNIATSEQANALRQMGVQGTLSDQQARDVQKANIDLQQNWAKLQQQVRAAGPEAGNKYLGAYNAKENTNYTLADLQGTAPQIDMLSGRLLPPTPVTTTPSGTVATTPSGTVATTPSGTVATTPSGTVATTPSGGRVTTTPSGVTGGSPGARDEARDIRKAGALENIQVQGARSQAFNKILDEEVRPQAQAGDTVSSVRKQQFAIFDRPGVDSNKLFGLYNAAAEGTGDQKASILRDIFGGIFKPEAEVSQRLAALNLTPQEKSALMEYNTANQRVNAATLKQNAGPGAVSDAEQRANREANVDITKVPALGAFNAMAQSQFDGDRARWKADWALSQPAQNALQLDRAWRKENQRLGEMYRETATQRAKFIAENGGTTAAVQLGYKRFPVPEYDPATETWKKTRPIGSYNR